MIRFLNFCLLRLHVFFSNIFSALTAIDSFLEAGWQAGVAGGTGCYSQSAHCSKKFFLVCLARAHTQMHWLLLLLLLLLFKVLLYCLAGSKIHLLALVAMLAAKGLTEKTIKGIYIYIYTHVSRALSIIQCGSSTNMRGLSTREGALTLCRLSLLRQHSLIMT